MSIHIDYRAMITLIALIFSIAINVHADTFAPLQTGDTLHMQPIDIGPDKGNRLPGQHVYAVVSKTDNGQMLLRFSQPVSCGIQMADMDGQPVLTARMRDEDIAILDVSRLHGRFQLIIRSDRWFATKAYWFP